MTSLESCFFRYIVVLVVWNCLSLSLIVHDNDEIASLSVTVHSPHTNSYCGSDIDIRFQINAYDKNLFYINYPKTTEFDVCITQKPIDYDNSATDPLDELKSIEADKNQESVDIDVNAELARQLNCIRNYDNRQSIAYRNIDFGTWEIELIVFCKSCVKLFMGTSSIVVTRMKYSHNALSHAISYVNSLNKYEKLTQTVSYVSVNSFTGADESSDSSEDLLPLEFSPLRYFHVDINMRENNTNADGHVSKIRQDIAAFYSKYSKFHSIVDVSLTSALPSQSDITIINLSRINEDLVRSQGLHHEVCVRLKNLFKYLVTITSNELIVMIHSNILSSQLNPGIVTCEIFRLDSILLQVLCISDNCIDNYN